MFYFLLFFTSLSGFTAERLKNFYFFPEGTNTKTLTLGHINDQREYEKSKVVLEEWNTSGQVVAFKWASFFAKNWLIEVRSELFFHGEYKENHGDELSYLPNRKSHVFGFQEPSFLLRKRISHNIHPLLEHGVELEFAPKIITAHQKNYARGASEFKIAYWWSYLKRKFEISGEIYTQVITSKKIRRIAGDNETTEAFTEAGIQFSPGFHFGQKFSTRLLLGLGHTTDYNTHNSEIQRLSDKGFVTYLGPSLHYDFTSFIASLSFYSHSYVFNSIAQNDRRNNEFEFEKKSASFSIVWDLE
jgi:hypothetical protein